MLIKGIYTTYNENNIFTHIFNIYQIYNTYTITIELLIDIFEFLQENNSLGLDQFSLIFLSNWLL